METDIAVTRTCNQTAMSGRLEPFKNREIQEIRRFGLGVSPKKCAGILFILRNL